MTKRRVASAKLCDSIDLKQLNMLKTRINYAHSIIKLTHILLSTLHMWTLDGELDKLFAEHLNLQMPKYPVGFGRISRGFHMFVMFPPRKPTSSSSSSSATAPPLPPAPVALSSSAPLRTSNSGLTDPFDLASLAAGINSPARRSGVAAGAPVAQKSIDLIRFDLSDESPPPPPPPPPTPAAILAKPPIEPLANLTAQHRRLTESHMSRAYWLATKLVSTEHLLAILAISNSFMNLQSLIDLQLKKE